MKKIVFLLALISLSAFAGENTHLTAPLKTCADSTESISREEEVRRAIANISFRLKNIRERRYAAKGEHVLAQEEIVELYERLVGPIEQINVYARMIFLRHLAGALGLPSLPGQVDTERAKDSDEKDNFIAAAIHSTIQSSASVPALAKAYQEGLAILGLNKTTAKAALLRMKATLKSRFEERAETFVSLLAHDDPDLAIRALTPYFIKTYKERMELRKELHNRLGWELALNRSSYRMDDDFARDLLSVTASIGKSGPGSSETDRTKIVSALKTCLF